MTKFKRSASHNYTLITPSTTLGELEAFLKDNIFALGEAPSFYVHRIICSTGLVPHNQSVTDSDRKFVLALATQSDLDVCRLCSSSLLRLICSFVHNG